MSHCADVARQNGKARLTLNTSLKNVTAQNFYESIGYVRLSNIQSANGSILCSYELKLR
jgi:ribosomal protein S18 acetylase RimI-like enzyme